MGATTNFPRAFPDVTTVRDQPNSFVIKSKKKGNPYKAKPTMAKRERNAVARI
jgi:hypothetical protein